MINKKDCLEISELNIIIEKNIHHKNKTYAECEKDCPKGWQIPTYKILQWLRNSEYRDELNLLDTWEFMQNPDDISKKNGYIARFIVNSDRGRLYCDGDASYFLNDFGVRYMKILKEEK